MRQFIHIHVYFIVTQVNEWSANTVTGIWLIHVYFIVHRHTSHSCVFHIYVYFIFMCISYTFTCVTRLNEWMICDVCDIYENETFHTYEEVSHEWDMSRWAIIHDDGWYMWMRHFTHMNKTIHTYEWANSYIWMRRFTHMNEWTERQHKCLIHMYHQSSCIVAHREWSISHIRIRQFTHMNELIHTYKWGI